MKRSVRPEIPLSQGTRKLVLDFQKLCEKTGAYHTNANLTAIYVEAETFRNEENILMCGLIWHAPNEEASREMYRKLRAAQFAHADYYKKIYKPIKVEESEYNLY